MRKQNVTQEKIVGFMLNILGNSP